ncbi:hypothetical protein K432DRAFT_385208 [Lepidopterella palustris CBS 459.81]|uniref:BZIP domain-containing protein n=1 Tax=Lepidopterella palustris CBS 459.81 TaxID=1314670 RepID=A0A8E2E3H8_9PEZI|nr:hypothetical protein K432DRAFT_385208 [Lepidopterella palustris CBS 459.81]
MTSSESEEQPTSRKRSRTSASSEDTAGKKARGRPRVDTQDETAADRRRTQIRLAQRAYRQRKETTISSLKKTVSELQSAIDEMNQSFLRFNDSALNSGILSLRPELARELKATTETFVKLARAAAIERNATGDDEAAEADLDPAAEFHQATAISRASRESQTNQAPSVPPIPEHHEIGWGYSLQPVETVEESHQRDTLSATTYFPPMRNSPYELAKSTNSSNFLASRSGNYSVPQSNNRDRDSQFSLIDTLMHSVSPNSIQPQTFYSTIPSPPIISPPPTRTPTPPNPAPIPALTKTMTLRAPYTYSFQESTFARRLARATIERGFHLLSMASLRPAAVNHVFKLSLPYMTPEQMLLRFRNFLSKSTSESLECWQTPFIHLGGAGTHYPRRDEHGNVIKPPNSWNVRSIGPFRRLRLENTADHTLSQDIDVDLRGFEGEWFDAHDVEGYLEELGVHIDPQASFAEAYIDVDGHPGLDLALPASLTYSPNINVNRDLAKVERPAAGNWNHSQSQHFDTVPSPSGSGTSTYTSGADSAPSVSTSPPRTPGMSDLDQMLATADSPFGLDMGVGSDFGGVWKLGEMDTLGMFEQPLGMDLGGGVGGFDGGSIFQDMGMSLGLDMMGVPSGQQQAELRVPGLVPEARRREKRAVVVDVAKLIEEIVKRAVCLGRAPGFRRKDVDMAFKASLIQAY